MERGSLFRVDTTIARFGRLDIAVNNAGTVGTPGSAADVTPESYQAIFDTNVLGVLLCMKYEIRAMLRQGKGSIVNISSSYGKVGGPTAAVYVGSKHAVEGITKSAAIELAGTGVRVNILGGGWRDARGVIKARHPDGDFLCGARSCNWHHEEHNAYRIEQGQGDQN